MKSSLDILIQHALATMSDSLTEKRRLLQAALTVVSDSHRAASHIRATLDTLNEFDRQQKNLPLRFEAKGTK